MEIKFNFTDVFNKEDHIDLLMLDICSARDDLYRFNKLLLENENNIRYFLWLFKYVIVATREAFWLLHESEKDPDFKDLLVLSGMEDQYKELLAFDKEDDGKSFSKSMLFLLRNYTLHFKHKSFNEVDFSNFGEQKIIIGKTQGETLFPFTDSIYYEYLNALATRAGLDHEQFIHKVREIGIKTVKLLDVLIAKYLNQYTNLEDVLNDLSMKLMKKKNFRNKK